MNDDEKFMALAIQEAETGWSEGGIPIGSVLVVDGEVLGRGHNQRVQKSNPILHAEMDALQSAGRMAADDYRRATIYTTLSPCVMCTGAILLYGIARVVIGESKTFTGREDLLAAAGVELKNLGSSECVQLMERLIEERPDLWSEDIGEPSGRKEL